MPDLGVRIRVMRADDLTGGLRLSAQAGWNQTPQDWRRIYRLAGEGAFVAEAEARMVGTAVAVRFGEVAWIAMVLVEESLRGRGIGTSLVRHALAFCDAAGVATVRLDATPLGRPVYVRLGFQPDYELIRYAGTAPGGPEQPTPLGEGEFGEICRLDREVMAYDRGNFLRELLAESPTAFCRHHRDGELRGFAYARPGRIAGQIGPCVALDATAGLSLLNQALQGRKRQFYIDVPVPNEPAAAWACEAGLTEQRRLLRMHRGGRPAGRADCLWASSGPEKG